MSKSTQIVWWVIVVVLIVGGLAWWLAGSQTPSSQPYAATQTQTPTGQTQNGAPSNSIVSNGTSDAALNGDLSNVDGQMNSFNSDSASVDQGLNDQPVPQQSL